MSSSSRFQLRSEFGITTIHIFLYRYLTEKLRTTEGFRLVIPEVIYINYTYIFIVCFIFEFQSYSNTNANIVNISDNVITLMFEVDCSFDTVHQKCNTSRLCIFALLCLLLYLNNGLHDIQ